MLNESASRIDLAGSSHRKNNNMDNTALVITENESLPASGEQETVPVNEEQETASASEEQDTQAESEARPKTKTHGLPSEENALRRVNAELNQTKQMLNQTLNDNKALMTAIKAVESRFDKMEEANLPPEDFGLETEDGEYPPAEQVKKALAKAKADLKAEFEAKLANLEGKVNVNTEKMQKAKAFQTQEINRQIGIIDQNGRNRFSDWDTVADRTQALIETGKATLDDILSAKDPARRAYELGGGIQTEKTKGTKMKTIANNESHTATLTNVPAGQAGTRIPFERLVELPLKELAKIPEADREWARLDYNRRKGIA